MQINGFSEKQTSVNVDSKTVLSFSTRNLESMCGSLNNHVHGHSGRKLQRVPAVLDNESPINYISNLHRTPYDNTNIQLLIKSCADINVLPHTRLQSDGKASDKQQKPNLHIWVPTTRIHNRRAAASVFVDIRSCWCLPTLIGRWYFWWNGNIGTLRSNPNHAEWSSHPMHTKNSDACSVIPPAVIDRILNISICIETEGR